MELSKNRDIEQLYIEGAFLHASLPETDNVWIRITSIGGINIANGKIVQLVKSLYGLRQAPKLW